MRHRITFGEPVIQESIIKLFAADLSTRGPSYNNENKNRCDVQSLLPLEIWLYIMFMHPSVYLLLAYTCKDLRLLAMHPRNMAKFNRVFMYKRTYGEHFEHIYNACVCGFVLGYSRLISDRRSNTVHISYSDHCMDYTLCKTKTFDGKIWKVTWYMDTAFSYTYVPLEPSDVVNICGNRKVRNWEEVDDIDDWEYIDPLKNGGNYVELMSPKTLQAQRKGEIDSRKAAALFHWTDVSKISTVQEYAHACTYINGLLVAEVIRYYFIPPSMLHSNRSFLGNKCIVERRYYYDDHIEIEIIVNRRSSTFNVKRISDVTFPMIFSNL